MDTNNPPPVIPYAEPTTDDEKFAVRMARRSNWSVGIACVVWVLIAFSYFWPESPQMRYEQYDFGYAWITEIVAICSIIILIPVGTVQGYIATASTDRPSKRRAYIGLTMSGLQIVLIVVLSVIHHR